MLHTEILGISTAKSTVYLSQVLLFFHGLTYTVTIWGFGTKDTLRVTAMKQRAEELVSGNQNSWILIEAISMGT